MKHPTRPPKFLYHGTNQSSFDVIQNEGLRPMERQYVHLSIDKHIAKIVGSRKKGNLIVLKVKANEACLNGIQFYKEDNDIWLSNSIPSKYITLQPDDL